MRGLKKKRLISFLLAALLMGSLACPALAAESEEVIHIRSEQDLIALSQHCRLDTWSEGKVVSLDSDIVLTHAFMPAPIFSGIFYGNRHTISGLKVNGELAAAGLFGILTETAEVRELRVEGRIVPQGETISAGGIAGENRGLIENCIFAGEVSSRKTAGGIAGKNTGIINGCSSSAYVNAWLRDGRFRISDLKEVSSLGELTGVLKLHSSENIGGITGENTGIIYSCNSYGIVGKDNSGYAIGGIAGKNNGYIALSTNRATVYGKSNVGGIVGQSEPYVRSSYSSDLMERPQERLDEIAGIIYDVTGDLDTSTENIAAILDQMLETVGRATDGVQRLERSATAFVNGKIGEINEVKDYANLAVNGISGVTSGIDEIGTAVSTGLHDIQDGVTTIKIALETEDTDKIQEALQMFSHGLGEFVIAMDGVDDTTTELNRLFENLDARGLPSFAGIGSDFDAATASIMGELKTLTGQIGQLSDEIVATEKRVTDNVRTITDEAQSLARDVLDLAYDLTSLKISSLIRNDTDTGFAEGEYPKGVIQSCLNTGHVKGTSSVGGIVGTMTQSGIPWIDSSAMNIPASVAGINVEQVAESVAQTGKIAVDNGEKPDGLAMKTLCYRDIMNECRNYGTVIARGNDVGGICGSQKIGAIVACEGYGTVTSKSGEGVGGIAGSAHGLIRDCFVRAALKGNAYVGGIIGSGSEKSVLVDESSVLGCFADVAINDSSQHRGGIAGMEDGFFIRNYFVSGELNGIGEYSREFEAAPITRQNLLEQPNCPKEFSWSAAQLSAQATKTVKTGWIWNRGLLIAETLLFAAIVVFLILALLKKKKSGLLPVISGVPETNGNPVAVKDRTPPWKD